MFSTKETSKVYCKICGTLLKPTHVAKTYYYGEGKWLVTNIFYQCPQRSRGLFRKLFLPHTQALVMLWPLSGLPPSRPIAEESHNSARDRFPKHYQIEEIRGPFEDKEK